LFCFAFKLCIFSEFVVIIFNRAERFISTFNGNQSALSVNP